ncbi:IS1 family transposase, partial [Shigella sonnei]|uniref:IS1 family transposase n=2 Tax=Shigella sonnei TaxID=624 RepID=UPI002093659F
MASVSISCPSCSATDGVVRNGKSTAGHQRYLCSHCRKTWQLQFTYTASQPGTHQKIIDMAMNGHQFHDVLFRYLSCRELGNITFDELASLKQLKRTVIGEFHIIV